MSRNYRTEYEFERIQKINSIKQNISCKLLKARDREGLTQDQLAGFALVSRKTICEYEKGECNMTVETLIKISRALNMDISDVIKE